MSPNPDAFMARVAQFDHKLRSYSRFFAHNAGYIQADDLYQEALLKLWERYCSEPDFLSNNNSYINNRRRRMVQTLGNAWRVPPSEREQLIIDL